jgi:glycosyltransferase involved in cell wall biosynthesis
VKVKPILQYGNLAGWPYKVAEALSAIGQPSVNVIPEDRDFADLRRKLPFHETVSRASSPRIVKFAQRMRFLAGIPRCYSLVHYHASHLLRGTMHHFAEGPYLARAGVPMIVSFAGSDARPIAGARRHNPYFFREPDDAHDRAVKRYLASISRYIRYAATDCEMAEHVAPYFDRVFTFRQPVDLRELSCTPQRFDRTPVLLHVPTDTEVKGTAHILAAVEKLRQDGLSFEFRTRRRLTQQEFYREIEDCDVYIDELRCGSHGVTAVEAMAAGKAVVTYIREDLVDQYPPELPIVNANPDTVAAVLRRLIIDTDYRVRHAEAGRRYVEKYHDALVVARDLLDIYRQIGLGQRA